MWGSPLYTGCEKYPNISQNGGNKEMTNKEHNALKRFFNRRQAMETERNNAFTELQEMSRKNGLPAWCCAEDNRNQLQNVSDESDRIRANYLYEKYIVLGAKLDLLNDLGGTLAELNFWKNH